MTVNINEWPRKIGESIKSNPVPYGALAVALTGLGIVEAPYSHGPLNGLDHIASGLLAIPTWELPTEQGLIEMLRSSDGVRDVAKWLAIDGGLVIVGGFIEKGISAASKLIQGKKEERMLMGIEPIDQKENPSHVFIGPSGMISDLAEIMEGAPSGKKEPIVGIHIDQEIPAVWGQEMKYHFKLNNPNELIGRFPPSTKKMSYIEATGLDRASEITFTCINPDNALFYGDEAQSSIPPTFVSTLIRKLSAEKLRGKKINVIYNEETELGGTSAIAKELTGLTKELGFTLNLITPEEIFIEKVTQDLEEISRNKEKNKSINITLVGQGKTETDQEMLLNFKKALGKIRSRRISNKIRVSLLQRRHLNKFSTEDDEVGTTQISEEEMRDRVKRSLTQSDYILVYGDQDHGTSTLSRLLLFDYKVPKEKIHSIAERLSNQFDFMDVEKVYIIYQMIIDRMKQSRQ